MIKENDFVEIDYVGETGGKPFDTTLEEYGKDFQNKSFKPITVIIGAEHIIKGLETAIKSKNPGDNFEVDIKPEEGFGKRKDELVQLISLKRFKKEKINPYPGLIMNIDGAIGAVKSVSGGRVIMDFNHPLAGRELHYKVWIRRIITDKNEMLAKLVDFHTGEDANVEENQITYEKEIPAAIKKKIFEDAKNFLKMGELKFIQIWK